MSALTLAAREQLDNLIWVVNCNLQRLDGPVRGNSRIIDELEALFAGAGWRVIKLVWGSDWDGLFARDTDGALAQGLRQHRRRPVPDLRRQGRALQPGSLLRPEPAAGRARPGADRRADRPPEARRPRPGQDPRRLRRGAAQQRPADRHPGADQEGLRHGRRRPGPHDHAPAEEARARRPDRLPQSLQPAADRRAGRSARLRTSRPTTARRCATCTSAAPHSAAACRRASRRADAVPVPALARLRRLRDPGRRQGDEHDDGLRAHADQPAEGQAARPARRADRRRRGAHLRHGQPVQAGRHLFERRPDLRARGHRLASSATARRPTARSWRKASARRARSAAGPRRRPATRCMARRCCRSTSTTRCSASSASAT